MNNTSNDIARVKKSVYVFCFMTLFMLNGYAQNIQLTQYMFNGLAINPAYAGAEEALSLTFLNRSQWKGLEGAPVTQTFSAHTLFKNDHVGLGTTIINDKIGVHKNLAALGSFAYHIKLAPKSVLSMGLQAGMNNQKSDYLSIAGNMNSDPKALNTAMSRTLFDFGVGLYYRTPKYDLGLSLPQIVQHAFSINDSLSISLGRSNYYLFSKYRFTLTDNLNLEPSFLIKYLPGLPISYDVNMNLVISKALTMGLSYRTKESLDFLLKGQITKQLQLGYAYDHVIGVNQRMASSSHELMVNYLFKYAQRKVTSPR